MSNRIIDPNKDPIGLEVLKEFQHPEDPRVIRAPLRPVFESVQDPYQAAVWQRHELKNAKFLLRIPFKRWAVHSPGPGYTDVILGQADEQGKVELESAPDLLQEALPELQDMADTYHRLSGIRDIEIDVIKNFTFFRLHLHNYPVLNCSWSLPDGLSTCWRNETGRELQAGEGDWFYFRPQFMHYSPPLGKGEGDDRVSVIVRQSEATISPQTNP